MRRYRRSYLRSFASGLLLAGLPVVLFLGADYLLSPPAPGTPERDLAVSADLSASRARTVEPSNATTYLAGPVESADAWPTSPTKDVLPPEPVARPPETDFGKTARDDDAPSHASRSGQRALVRAIQGELRRVGCLAGAPDGRWTDATRLAMTAFNESVQVNLSTAEPDYILLTLLQGHNARACHRACVGNACRDPVIEAKIPAPAEPVTRPRRSAVAGEARKSWSTTVAASPVVVVRPEGPAPRAVGSLTRSPATVGIESPGKRVEPSEAATAAPAHGLPLDGRMAAGLPVDAVDGAAHGPGLLPPVVSVPRELAKPRANRSAASSHAGKNASRAQRTFSVIGANAP